MPSQNYSRRIQEEEATYPEVDLPGTRTPVAAPKVLYGKEKEERISDKENDYEELLQKVLNVCNTLSREIVQIKEETARMNVALELEGLVLNEIKGFDSEILVKEELEKGKGPTFGSYPGFMEMDHGCKTDELGNLELERKIVMKKVESKVIPVKSDDKIKEFEKIKVSKVDDKSDKKPSVWITWIKRLGSSPKKGNEVEGEASQNYLKYKTQKPTETNVEKDEINEDNCSEIEGLKKRFGLDDDGVNRTLVDERNGVSPVKDKKTKLEWNLDYRRNVDSHSINMKTEAADIGVKNNVRNSIILVSKVNNKEDKRIEKLPESHQEVVQNIEYAEKDKVVASEVGECMNIVEYVDNEIVDPLFDPGGSIFPKIKETKLESKTNSYLNPIICLMRHCPSLC
ncbi:1018_t:CDS:2, partial [Gigaspora margarita]